MGVINLGLATNAKLALQRDRNQPHATAVPSLICFAGCRLSNHRCPHPVAGFGQAVGAPGQFHSDPGQALKRLCRLRRR